MVTLAEFGKFAQYVYNDDGASYGNWQRQKWHADKASGFFGAIFQDRAKGDVVVACRGTELTDVGDLGADVNIAKRKMPMSQVVAAIELWSLVATMSGVKRTFVTGHSLGGALAQIVSCAGRAPCITFNAPGMKDHMGHYLSHTTGQGEIPTDFVNGSVHNYRLKDDFVSSLTGKHLGKVTTLDAQGGSPETFFQKLKAAVGMITGGFEAHKMQTVREFIMRQAYADSDPFS